MATGKQSSSGCFCLCQLTTVGRLFVLEAVFFATPLNEGNHTEAFGRIVMPKAAQVLRQCARLAPAQGDTEL